MTLKQGNYSGMDIFNKQKMKEDYKKKKWQPKGQKNRSRTKLTGYEGIQNIIIQTGVTEEDSDNWRLGEL